jgi:hypothetical protein
MSDHDGSTPGGTEPCRAARGGPRGNAECPRRRDDLPCDKTQAELWAHGETIPMRSAPETIRREARHTLALTP